MLNWHYFVLILVLPVITKPRSSIIFIIIAKCKQGLMFASQVPYCCIATPSKAIWIGLPHGLGS